MQALRAPPQDANAEAEISAEQPDACGQLKFGGGSQSHNVIAWPCLEPITFLNDQLGQSLPALFQRLPTPTFRFDSETSSSRAVHMADQTIGAAQQQTIPRFEQEIGAHTSIKAATTLSRFEAQAPQLP
ncbi:MAG: hypothetical protein ACO3FK_04045 [Vulcanococcus sp.]